MQHPTNRCFRKRKQRRSFETQFSILLLKLGNEHTGICMSFSTLLLKTWKKIIRVSPVGRIIRLQGPTCQPTSNHVLNLKTLRAQGRTRSSGGEDPPCPLPRNRTQSVGLFTCRTEP